MKKQTQKQPVGRPPKGPLDNIRTILWFWTIADRLALHSAYAIEKYYFVETTGSDSGFISTGKFKNYKSGKHMPSEAVIAWFETRFKGTRYWLDHPFWDIARPCSELEMLYKHMSKLRSEIRNILFYSDNDTKRAIPIRRWSRSTDELCELDIESDFDALSACVGLLQETMLLDKDPYTELHRLIVLRILSRVVLQLPTIHIMPELFTYLRSHFLEDLNDQQWTRDLDTLSFETCKWHYSKIQSIIRETNILKYFNDPPPRCIYYGDFYLSAKEIYQLWNNLFDVDIDKIKNHPSMLQLTSQIKRWERQCLKYNSITQYPGLKPRPVNSSTVVS